MITFQQSTSVSPMSTLAIRIEPSIVRMQDADSATVQVTLDNRRGRSGVRLFLNGGDPERAIGFTFSPPVLDLGPGQIQAVSLRLDSWRPPPGQETTRQFTITASDGYTSVDASGSLVQASSRAAIELLGVRLDPIVLRLSGRRGALRAMIDNRNGAQPIRVALRGDDPENIVRFAFVPSVLDIPPGQVGSSNVTITAPRAPAGQQVTRPFAVLASDGRSEVQAEGTLIQSSAERRPLARILLTLFGALAMIIGAFSPWRAVSEQRGVDLTVDTFAQAFGFPLNLMGAEFLISVGLAILVLAALMIFGLTGRSGRLTRMSALLAALLLFGTFVAVAVAGGDLGPGRGAILVLIGCVAGYIGGLLGRR
jgi:P pilus assembly chaperone PapD